MESPRKLVLFDMDKTLVEGNSWYRLNTAMGITPDEDELLYRLGPEKEGILAYDEWLHILAQMMIKRRHPSRTDMEKVLLNYTFAKHAIEVIGILKDRGYNIAIISGGFNLLVDDVARR